MRRAAETYAGRALGPEAEVFAARPEAAVYVYGHTHYPSVRHLDGRVVITLEKIDAPAQKARVRVKVLGGREGVVVMGPVGGGRLGVDSEWLSASRWDSRPRR